MGIFKNYLLVSDIDGTLLDNGVIPQRNIEAIDYFIKESGKFSIASGRSIEAVRPIYKNSHSNAPCVVFNGAVVFDYNLDKIVCEIELDDQDKSLLAPIMNRFPTVGVEVHSGRKLYVIRRTKEVDDHIEYESIASEDMSLEDVMSLTWTKSIIMTEDGEIMKQLMEFCDTLSPKSAYFLPTSNIYLELTSSNANKAKGIAHLKDYLGKGYTVCAIGDYYNDIEMLKYADIGCSTADSPQAVKDVSDYEACKCSEGAVADFIEYLAEKIHKDLA